MPTNKQRRDAQRRHLERQLERRREREIRRRKSNLILSIVGTLVLIAVVIALVVGLSGGNDKKPAASSNTPTTTATSSTPTAPSTSAAPSVSYAPATGKSVTFQGVTVKGASDLKGYPVVTSKSSATVSKMQVKDLVVGTGKAATPTSSVTVQYYGVLYKNGTYFDSSWKRGMPAQFSLQGVVPGFTQGIGGTTGIAPMKVGGRRIIIVPSALGYGKTGQPPTIPANADLVFIVDLKSVDS